jgi:hypothetical protein
MAILDTKKESSKGVPKFTVVKYYSKPNGSAVINLPKGFDVGFKQGEELVAKWDGSKVILMPLKMVKFE